MNRIKTWPKWDRRQDRELWDHFASNIIEPGWAGKLSVGQTHYIHGVLTKKIKSPYFRRGTQLRHRWGFSRESESITDAAIRVVAMRGDPYDPAHNAELVRGVNGVNEEKSGAIISHQSVQLTLWALPQDTTKQLATVESKSQ